MDETAPITPDRVPNVWRLYAGLNAAELAEGAIERGVDVGERQATVPSETGVPNNSANVAAMRNDFGAGLTNGESDHLTSYVTVRVRLSIVSAPSYLLKVRKQSGNLMKRRCSPFLPMPYLMRARSAGTDVSANTIGAVPVTAFASTRSRHEIQRESEQDRRRRGWRVGSVALNTSVASAATVDTSAWYVLVNRDSGNGNSSASGRRHERTHLTKSEQRTLLIRSRAPSRPIWERSLLRTTGPRAALTL